jgi:hypothetical protein
LSKSKSKSKTEKEYERERMRETAGDAHKCVVLEPSKTWWNKLGSWKDGEAKKSGVDA